MTATTLARDEPRSGAGAASQASCRVVAGGDEHVHGDGIDCSRRGAPPRWWGVGLLSLAPITGGRLLAS